MDLSRGEGGGFGFQACMFIMRVVIKCTTPPPLNNDINRLAECLEGKGQGGG